MSSERTQVDVRDVLDGQIALAEAQGRSTDGLRATKAAVVKLIVAAIFTLEPGSDITSAEKLRQSRERLRAALAACQPTT